MKSTKYKVCRYCGSALDYGETCECRENELWAEEMMQSELAATERRRRYAESLMTKGG